MKHIQLLTNSEVFKHTQVSHACIISGEDSVGVSGLCRVQACKIVCKADVPCMQCVECRLILEDKHNDVIVVDKEKLVVDDVDEILENLLLTPYGDSKVYLISNFDTATPQAQNKLLKSIEEPPKNVYFVLGASNTFNILPTILSRCNVAKVMPFEKEQLKQSMLASFADDENLELALSLSFGQISKVENFLNNPKFKLTFDNAISVLCTLKTSADILSNSKLLVDNKENLRLTIDYIALILRDVLAIKNNSPDLVISGAYTKDIIQISKIYTTNAIISILTFLNTIHERIKQYGNTNSIVDNLLFEMLELKFKNRAEIG